MRLTPAHDSPGAPGRARWQLPPGVARARPWILDLLVGLVLFVSIAWLYASDANPYKKEWSQSTFYERYYGTAVLSACGHPWESPRRGVVAPLDDFLNQKSDNFNCADLPAEIETGVLEFHAVDHHYLHRTVVLAWRLLGEISWSGLDSFYGTLCGLVIALYYGVFRLGMGRLLSIAGALALVPLHLIWAKNLRDFSKAPFFLLVFLLLGLLIRKPFSPKRTIALAIAAGGAIGLGAGFRSDILIATPAVVVTLLFFLPTSWRSSWKVRLTSVAALALTAFLFIAPLQRFEDVQLPARRAHWALLGLTNVFTNHLGVENSHYEWSHIYSDPWAAIQVKSYAHLDRGLDEYVQLYSPRYDELGTELLTKIVRDHPADFLLRASAAVAQLVKMPFVWLGLLLVLVSVDWRRGLWLALFVLYFGGYAAAQFHHRHYFHLEFFPLWLTGLTIQLAISSLTAALGLYRKQGWQEVRSALGEWLTRARRPVAVALVLIPVLLTTPLLALRAYQSARVEKSLEAFESAPVDRLTPLVSPLEGGAVRLELDADSFTRLPAGPGDAEVLGSSDELRSGYLVIDVEPGHCPLPEVDLTLRYAPGAYHDFSRPLTLASQKARRVFAPIYSRERSNFGDSVFLGVEVPEELLPCLEFAVVRDPTRLAPLVFVDLPEGWRQDPLYQRLGSGQGSDQISRSYGERLGRIRWRWRNILDSWRKSVG